MKTIDSVIITAVIFVAFFGIIIFVLSKTMPDRNLYPHQFEKGECVTSKLDGLKGMIVGTYKYHDGVRVRFASHTAMTSDSFLGGTHDVREKPFAVVTMNEFELKSCGRFE